MHKHASINRAFRLIWNEALSIWVPVAEIARGRRKRSRRAVLMLAALGLQAYDASAAPPSAELPTGGNVVAGAATISQGAPAVLNINQSTQRAVIDWNTFNVGSEAQVNFNQPGRDSATLNRVLDSSPSQIFGNITANGQVFLTNPNGVHFGKSATVDVGGLVATTHGVDTAEFMSGNTTLTRNGATGSVVNEGQLNAALGGYIALLAPEVRNSGIIVAKLGTVALAAGEAFTLNFDGAQLASITAEPATIAALVENKSAIVAPGGVIILSAKAVDRLQGGVVRNSGTLEATGLAMQGGRIVLEASDSVENTGTINANAGVDGSPAGSIAIDAPSIINTEIISASAASFDSAAVTSGTGGAIALSGAVIEQGATGALDVSGVNGGDVHIQATESISLAGQISAATVDALAPTSRSAEGGNVTLQSLGDITLQNVLIDVSGGTRGGAIVVQGGRTPAPTEPHREAPTLALIGATELRTSSRRGRGGSVTLSADRVGLFDHSAIDATGASGGGDVFVGGGFHGKDPSIANAQQVVIGRDAHIDASATHAGDAGNVAVWADGYTQFSGNIKARGGATAGAGGFVEVSGAGSLNFRGNVDAGAAHGAGGTLLLDPKNITVQSGGGAATGDVDQFSDNAGADSTIDPNTITAMTNAGTGVTLQANNDIEINSAIVTNSVGTGGALVFRAGRSITVNANIDSDDGNVSFTTNDATVAGNRDAGAAAFVNNSLIDAGTGTVSITMGNGALGGSGAIATGQVTAGTLTITHNGPTAGPVSGAIDLGELNIANSLTITANAARNVVNTVGDVVVHGTTTINVGAGDVTVDRATTNFNIIGLTANNVTLRDTNAMRFAASTISGNLIQTTVGPIGSTGAVQVTGTTNLTANTGGFGYADPYIDLTNPGNNFVGAVTLNVPSNGQTSTGGYATIRDSGAITIASANTSRALTVQAGGAITTGTITAGTNVTVSTTAGAVNMDSTTAAYLIVNATGAVDLGPTTLSADMTVTTNGAITDSGTITVQQAVLTAGAGNDIILDQALNNFNSVQIVSARDVTLVDQNAINFGSSNSSVSRNSHISRNLNLTAGGDITQTRYTAQDNYSRIQVDGTTLFTANHASAQIGLYLGANDALTTDGNSIGQQNNFAGAITLARSNVNTGFDDVQLRNVNSAASVLTGLTSVGTLNNVSLRFDSAPSVELPGMTVTGTLRVYAPGVTNTAGVPTNIISQTGAIVVTGATIVAAGSTGDIVLDNAGNNFSSIGVANMGGRNLTIRDSNAVVLYAPGYNQGLTGNLTVTAGGDISDLNHGYELGSGTITFDAGANDISFGVNSNVAMNRAVITAARNVVLNPRNSVALGNVNATGTLSLRSRDTGSLTQIAATSVRSGGITTFDRFNGGVTLAESGNVMGALAIINAGAINIRENDAITQAAAWTNWNASGGNTTRYNVTLTTSDDQAITLDQAGSVFGNLTITQINNGALSAGAVYVRETGDSMFGMTQGSAWTVHGTTQLDSGANSINLNNQNNILGPLQVTGATGTTNALPSTVTIYAKETATTNAITDVGGTGAWNTGNGAVNLVAYDTTGTTAGGGDVILTNAGNVLGDLYVRATNATITENGSITDGVTGWITTGTTRLIVANPTGKSITLDNLNNQLGALAINTTGTAGTLSSVLITDNTNLTQAAAWLIGAAPLTLDARTHQIDLSTYDNVLGAITINTSNGTPTAVAITEDDAITQGSVWALTGVPVTLIARNDKTITLTNASNIMGNLTITGGVVSITENDSITQGGAWKTTGTTTLNAGANAITLANTSNVLGALAIAGTPTGITIAEDDDITQASAWTVGTTPVTLNAGTHDVLLTQANNQLGDLTVTAQNASITENHAAGITDGSAWTVAGTTTLTAGGANPIVLNANPASNFGTVSIVSASNADIADIDGIVFGNSTISAGGTLTVTAGGAITQIGSITAPSLRLIGTGYATLNNVGNNVQNLAAGFSGGDLAFTNAGNFAVAVIGGTTGVTIGANDVALTSVAGTITGLSNINASSSSLTLSTGTALLVPQLTIAGAQTYTASTVSGGGITLSAGITSTAAGAINFTSPVTLGADLSIQSTNSDINFNGTLAGATHQLTVNAGSGTVDFFGAVSALGNTIDAGAALQLTSSGATFHTALGANNGLAITGPVTFNDTVTLANGNAASVFTGLVTLGKVGGMDLSGYDGMTFNGGVLLRNGPTTINSNNSALSFQTAGQVSGAFDLTLNSGTAALSGLDRLAPNLTSLTVTALNPTIPGGGVSIAGPQTYTATNGSNIVLSGNVTSTAAGAITFNSPVLVGASSTVSSTNSPIIFGGTLDGAHDLTVNSGSGTKSFNGAIGSVAALGDGVGAALILQGSGATRFNETVQMRSGITAADEVTFDKNVTLADGDTGSTFNGRVTTGGASGNSISGFDGIAFNGGLALVGGPVSILSNGSTLSFGAAVSGPRSLTLNALAGGAGTVTGLQHIGFNSDLTALHITAQTLSLPSTGLAVAGPMSFTAAGGITLNGAVGNNAGPATGQIDFTGPVNLATGAIVVTTNDAAINFGGTVDGGQALTVNAGTAATTFTGAVGAATALTSLTTDAGGTTAINGGSIRTTGAQLFNDAVTLGADTTLTGVGVTFGGTLNGARALTVNNSGATVFGGIVGGNAALTSITTDAPGTVVVNTTAVTTTGSQTYNENMTLGANVVFTGLGLSFDDIDGAHTLTANAGSGSVQVSGSIGGATPLTAVTTTGNSVSVHAVTTTGAQSYTAPGGITLNGNLATTSSNVTLTGPTTLAGNTAIATTGGNIAFSGATSTINGAHDLTLAAGSGNIVLGGVVGGVDPLTALTMTGNDLTLPGITTVGDANQSYTALNNITLNQSRTLNAPVSFTADADNDGAGSFILLNGVSLTASNNSLDIRAADLDLQGSSTLSSGTGVMSITATNNRNIALGGADAAGQLTISGSELSRMSSSGGLNLNTSGSGWIHVDGISAAQSQNLTGTLGLNAQGVGDVGFINAASTFNALTANATGGDINIGVNLTTSNDPIQFMTGVHVSGASTIASGGGDIRFDGTLDVDNDLILTTGNGALTFGAAVGSNRTLTLNLGGGSVTGLGNLQNTLTGLTVNSTSGISLPAFTINGPQVYNTGSIKVTGDLGGVGITFNNVVDVVPASGAALTIDARTGTLLFADLASFNAVDMTLSGDEIDFTRPVTGSGNLVLQPYTGTRAVAVGGSGAPIAGLNLTAAEMAWLPIGTLSGLTIGSAAGSGLLSIAGTLNAPGTPLTLNGGGGINQTAGSITSGALRLFAAGNAISLTGSGNAFGAVGITGGPSAVSLVNTLAITQLGAAAWNLGGANVTLNAGAHDITLNNAGNTFGTLSLTGRDVQVTEAAATDMGASAIGNNLTVHSDGAIHFGAALTATGNVSLESTGVVSQSAPLTIGGDLTIVTTVNAGDVTLNNSGASATSIGNTAVGGDYVLTATGATVSQSSGSSLQVRGDVTVTGASIVLGGAGNLIGGSTTLPATNTTELRAAGVITLGDRTESGNLTVISERTNRSFSSALVNGDAILLNDAANNIGGRISVTASAPTIGTGADVQTGINQSAGTSISVAGVASFTAEASGAGSLGIDLSNSGNSFGTLQLSGNTVTVKNDRVGLTTIEGALATSSLTLTTAGAISQTGPIKTPMLTIDAAGAVTLNHVANDVTSLSVDSNGNTISYVDANGFDIGALDAGGADVSLTAGGAGNLTQSAALVDVGALSANAGGAVTLTNAGNRIGSLGASTAGTGLQVLDSAGGLSVSGIVRTATGDMLVRTVGDLTLNSGARLQADAGDVVASTESAGNFINNASAGALVVGTGKRWLIYSSAPDLAAGPHTVKGGLTSSFRHYGATYGSYAPGAVTEIGNGFIYSVAAPTLTVSAIVNGAASHIYGDTPTGTLGVALSSGLLDSEDNVGNVITGGVATFDRALLNTMNAGSYSILYTGGLTSNYTLIADTTGATYTVTPAALTYTADAASRVYGAADPTFSGSLSGFKLGEDASILGGVATWTTSAVATSDVGNYAITGGGYTVGGNYTFVQAAANATALSITRAGLTVTASNDSKTYDGAVYSGGVGVTFSGFVNGEDASVLGGSLAYGGSSQGARNVGSYVLSVSGLAATNYDISYVNGSLAIDRANLVLTSHDVVKTYDGTLLAAGTAAVASGSQLFDTDSLSGGSFAFTDANAATGTKTVTVSGVTVNDGNGGANYNVSYVNNTTSTINPANIVIGTSNVTKTYDGTLAANGSAVLVSGTLFRNASNGNTQDSLAGGSFAFTDKNVGVGNRTVTTSGVTVNDGNAGGNYAVTYANNTTSTIDAATLTFTGTIANKEYDGTTTASVSGYALTGFVAGESVEASVGSAAFSDRNAGVGKAVTISGITLRDGANGGLASNYVVSPTAAAVGTIDPKLLTLSAVVSDKVYDGTTNATLQSYGLSGFVGSETVIGVNTGSASFLDKNVGNDKAITITGINLVNGTNGGLASNYAVPANALSTASITPAALHVAGVVALDKVYDGTTIAYLNTQAATVTGSFGGDDVEISEIYGSFLDKNVGTDKAIGAGTVVLSGADAGNYTLVQPTHLTADITPRALVVAATGVSRVYDGTTAAQVNLTDNRIAGDSLSITSTNAFLDKSAGVGKFINVSAIQIGGADAGNYTVNSTASTFANIDRAALTVTIVGVDKVYDSTTNAVVTLSGAPLSGDDVQLSFGSARFDDKNVGGSKRVSVVGIAASGADAANYAISTVGATTASITPASLTVGAIGVPKSYDGNANANVIFTDNRFAGDDVSLVASNASFADAKIGTGKTITVDGVSISGGADQANYVLANTTLTAFGDITGGESSAAGTWSLPPTLPTRVAPTTPAPSPALIDFNIPTIGGGGVNGAGSTGGSSGGGTSGTTAGGASFGTGAANAGNAGTSTVGAVAGGTGTVGTVAGGTGTVGAGAVGTGTVGAVAGGSGTVGAGTGGTGVDNTSADFSAPGANAGVTDARSGGTGAGGANTGLGGSGAAVGGTTTGVGVGSNPGASSTTSGTSAARDSGADASASAVAGSGADASTQIVVSMVRAPLGEYPGLVSVRVPTKIIAAGNGFTFALPKELAEAAATEEAVVSLSDNKPLPSWLRYVNATRSFVATNPPAGALPIEISIRIGDKRWTMTIGEQAD